jgi:hypothetical protein
LAPQDVTDAVNYMGGIAAICTGEHAECIEQFPNPSAAAALVRGGGSLEFGRSAVSEIKLPNLLRKLG